MPTEVGIHAFCLADQSRGWRAFARRPAFAPIQIGGVGFCNGFTEQVAWSSSKCEPFMSTKSSVHSRRTAVRHSSKRAPGLAARNAERLELDIAIADSGAEDEFAAA